jgi:dipeptidyl aminopeptidase/acylaminoacyl peptidase
MRSSLPRPTTRAFIALLILLLAGSAQAALRAIAPGERVALESNEGLLLIAIDSDGSLARAELRESNSRRSQVFEQPAAERSFQLFVATAGNYRWREAQLNGESRVALDPKRFGFAVKAGAATYAGDLVVRRDRSDEERVVLANHGLGAMDWLAAQHVAVSRDFDFTYAGNAPDPFVALYRSQRDLHATQVKRKAAPAPLPPSGPLPFDIATLWQPPRVTQARINPAGTIAALQDDDLWAVEFFDLRSGKKVATSHSAEPLVSMAWADDDTLATTAGDSGEPQLVQLLNVVAIGGGEFAVDHLDVPRRGFVIDTLPDDDDHLLFATPSRGQLLVHRMDISSQRAVDRFRPRLTTRLNRGAADDVAWYTDGAGNLRLAMVRRPDGYVLVAARNGKYDEVLSLTGKDAFDPYGASFDASELYGVTERDRAQRELVVFDVASRKVTKTLFAKAGVDVEAPIFDAQRNPIGVTYYEGGRLQSEYFAQTDRRMFRQLRNAFADSTVSVLDRSADGRHLIVSADASDRPAQLFHFDTASGKSTWLADSLPDLAGQRFLQSQTVSLRSRDGLPIEAFLTLPQSAAKSALVVLPHGGPIGIADRQRFEHEVQFLASLGYAVLRVNFRGSDGYGKAFREAGYRNYGTGIEDDIDAAIEHVLARFPIDGERMCVVGSSYGGFSALVAAARWPGRFRCAVSTAGIADLGLMFTASDAGRTDHGRDVLERIIGDPLAQQKTLRDTSPLYLAAAIRAPVMLVHGREDARVDFEHFERMQRMLTLAGNPPTTLTFDDEGHGVDRSENLVALWSGIAGFLRQYLAPASITTASVPQRH